MPVIKYDELFDGDSFVKTLVLARGDGYGDASADSLVTGYGTLGERLVFAAVDESSGTGALHGRNFSDRVVRTLEAAVVHGAPFILCLGGSSIDISRGARALVAYTGLINALKRAKGRVPLICVAGSDCIGIHSALASMCDFVYICGDDTYFGAVSAAAVKAFTYGEPDARSVGASVPRGIAAAGNCEKIAGVFKDTAALRDGLAELVSFLPESSRSGMPGFEYDFTQDAYDEIEGLNGRELIKAVCDNAEFCELGAGYGSEVITGFAAFGGRSAGVIGFDTSGTDGKVGPAGIRKLASFAEFCRAFRVPVVNLLDFSGIFARSGADAAELPVSIARLCDSMSSPIVSGHNSSRRGSVTVITGSACGELAAVIMAASVDNAGSIAYAWRGASVDAIDPAAAALMKYKDQIKADPDPVSAREKYIDLYKRQYSTAEAAGYESLLDDVIDPAETRSRIIDYLRII